MFDTPQYLFTRRKCSPLTQSDIAFLFGLSDHSLISHIENGSKMPTLDIAIYYHVLFSLPLESIYQEQRTKQALAMKTRIENLMHELQLSRPTEKIATRVEFLNTTLNRLSL